MLQAGGPAMGKDFFDREKEIRDVLRLLEKDNILLISPRRYGKTSLMREVVRRLSERDYLCLFLDIMYIDTPEKFVIELATAAFDVTSARRRFVRGLKDTFIRLSDLFDEIEASVAGTGIKVKFRGRLKEEINENNWTERGKDIFDAIKSMSNKKPIYIVIDELSECVNNMIKSDEDATKFLQWFRSIRQQTIQDLRFIVGGSVSFDRVVRGVSGLPMINNFERVCVEGFSRVDALEFIDKGFIEEELEYREEIGEKILECIGEPYVPFFTAIFLRMILQEAGDHITEEIVEETYNSKLLGAQGKGHFEHYKERLRIYYDEIIAKAAKEILKEACVGDNGIPKQLAFHLFIEATGMDDDERFVDLLYDLENDFYIKFDGENIRFQSKVFRDWWRLYHV
jgi:AAA+ ATPase superfamily predicted ATPase